LDGEALGDADGDAEGEALLEGDAEGDTEFFIEVPIKYLGISSPCFSNHQHK
jgi:hypothetical protein